MVRSGPDGGRPFTAIHSRCMHGPDAEVPSPVPRPLQPRPRRSQRFVVVTRPAKSNAAPEASAAIIETTTGKDRYEVEAAEAPSAM